MNNKLNLEAEPFKFNPEFDETSELFDSEVFSEESEEEVAKKRRRPVRSPVFLARTVKARQPSRSTFRPVKPPLIKFKPVKPLFPGLVIPPVVVHHPPYKPPDSTQPDKTPPGDKSGISDRTPTDGSTPTGAPPEGGQPTQEGSEYVRWVQNSLNRILGINLPLDGIMSAETRSAIRSFQEKQGLPVDGIVGPPTEKALIEASKGQPIGLSGAGDGQTSETEEFEIFDTELTKTSEKPKGSFGTLTIIAPKEYQFSYTFTPDDALWLARLIVGEAGGYDNPDNHAVIWATFNRFGLFTHSGSKWMQRARLRGYKTFASFIQSYSTTLQPVLHSAKAAVRAIALSKKNPQKYKYIETGGVYPGTSIPKGQLEHHLKKIQKMTWDNLRKETRNVVERALRGQLDNPIGIASEFANTYTYFKQNKGRLPKNYDEWRQYTEAFARSKRWTWIGEVTNLRQIKQNAFFIDNRVKHLPKDTVQVVSPKSNSEIMEYSFESEPFESYSVDEYEEKGLDVFSDSEVSAKRVPLQDVVKRAFGLLRKEQQKPWWEPSLGNEQIRRIGCFLLRMNWKGSDDRYVTGQMVLSYYNRPKPEIYFIQLKDLLTSASMFGPTIPDDWFLGHLRRIDESIIEGRHKINQIFAQQGAAVSHGVRWLRNWVADREKDHLSIYKCYRG